MSPFLQIGYSNKDRYIIGLGIRFNLWTVAKINFMFLTEELNRRVTALKKAD
jgi:hypothetical protein